MHTTASRPPRGLLSGAPHSLQHTPRPDNRHSLLAALPHAPIPAAAKPHSTLSSQPIISTFPLFFRFFSTFPNSKSTQQTLLQYLANSPNHPRHPTKSGNNQPPNLVSSQLQGLREKAWLFSDGLLFLLYEATAPSVSKLETGTPRGKFGALLGLQNGHAQSTPWLHFGFLRF